MTPLQALKAKIDTSKLPSVEVLFLAALALLLQAADANVGEDKGKNNTGKQIAKFLAVCGILYPAAWCAACQSFYLLKALANALGLPYNSVTIVPLLIRLKPILRDHYGILPSASCGKMIDWAKERGLWKDADDVPHENIKAGWLVFFDTAVDKWGRWLRVIAAIATHIGMVVKGIPFETVEGNTSDKDRADGDGIEDKPRGFGRVVGYIAPY